MNPYLFVLLFAASTFSTPGPVQAQKSALEGIQFDGVTADAALRTARLTRREWLELHPVQAREYWAAWDCKGRPCDSKWYANIRAKAALIKRTDKDPKPSSIPSARPERHGG